jgi:hypothetical protein
MSTSTGAPNVLSGFFVPQPLSTIFHKVFAVTFREQGVHGALCPDDLERRFLRSVGGYGQGFGTQPSDRVRLEGSTFGPVRLTGDALPTPRDHLPAAMSQW